MTMRYASGKKKGFEFLLRFLRLGCAFNGFLILITLQTHTDTHSPETFVDSNNEETKSFPR